MVTIFIAHYACTGNNKNIKVTVIIFKRGMHKGFPGKLTLYNCKTTKIIDLAKLYIKFKSTEVIDLGSVATAIRNN